MRRDEYISLRTYYHAPISGLRRRISEIRKFSPLLLPSISAGCISIYVCRYSALRGTRGYALAPMAAHFYQRRRLLGKGGRRRAFFDFSRRNRIFWHRLPIPPRDRHAAKIAKGRRRYVKRRAVEAIGVSPPQAARYTESLCLHPIGPNGGAAREPCAAPITSH